MTKLKYLFLLCLISGFQSFAQRPINYLSLPEQISFNDITYELTYSKHMHRSQLYAMHYFIPNTNTQLYSSKITFEFINDYTLEHVINIKIKELNYGKKLDPEFEYEQYDYPDGTKILTFMYVVKQGDGYILAERNVWCYSIIDTDELKGVVIFKAYKQGLNSEAPAFIENDTNHNAEFIATVKEFVIPPMMLVTEE